MTIDASLYSTSQPSVVGGGGTPLSMSAVLLTNNPRVPIGSPVPFGSGPAVASYFGAASVEASLAAQYFSGFIGCTQLPNNVYFVQYPEAPVFAYLRGGSVAAMTLAQLQALSGSLDVVIDGTLKSAASVNLATATSFTAAAEMLGTTLGVLGVECATFTGSIAGTVLTVTSMTTGTLNVGDVIAGAGVTAGTYITSAGTVSGTWNLSVTQTVATEAMTANNPGVGFDTISQAFVINSGTTGTTSTLAYATGTLSASLNLTQATGAVLSQGAIAATPVGAMNAIITQNTNWATFMTCWNATNAEKTGFAQWNGTQNNRFAYVMWDTNAAATVVPDTTTALSTILADGYGGVIPVYCDATLDPTGLAPAFVCGTIASINFSQKNGAITLAYRYQSGVPASVNDTQTAQNLRSNGYNFVGSVKANAQGFTFVDNGSVTGEFLYAGSYINQIYFNAQIQLSNLTLMTSVGVIPYNSAGAALIHAAHADPINQMLNFGGIQKGVSLSSLQAAEVNNAAGVQIDGILSTRGWYEQVGVATAQTRAAAGSPPNTIWYMYGGSVQKIAVSSVNVQ